MINLSVDIAVLGSGFGGSLLALILHRIGRSVALVDRASHPRFAIGESSTPIADSILADLADRYDLPRLKPLAKYGTWTATYPDIDRGLKRGFSYFHHRPGRAFETDANHTSELLVAASSADESADTHWLRADVDAFLVNEVRRAGIDVLEETRVEEFNRDGGWTLLGEQHTEPVEIRARFLIDATGAAAVIPRALGIPDDGDALKTDSRAVFGHFDGVRPWHDLLTESGFGVSDHPFPCDAAAVHHVLDCGWMWQLRFDSGVTSAGLVFDGKQRPVNSSRSRFEEGGWLGPSAASPQLSSNWRMAALDPSHPSRNWPNLELLNSGVSPTDEWFGVLADYPTLVRQFENATIVFPEDGLRQSARLQRCFRQAAGPDWALLPNTAGFVDPLHSTGIAHTLSGIERLAAAIDSAWQTPRLLPALNEYSQQLHREIAWIDCLVEGCYAARHNFQAFTAWSMLYFAAATTCEQRRGNPCSDGWSYLCADDNVFRKLVESLRSELDAALSPDGSVERFEDRLAQVIGPWNTAGLCDSKSNNMYRYTAAAK